MPKCQACQSHRSRLHKCARCGMRVCGCCSYRSIKDSAQRFCCYPGSACMLARRAEAKPCA